MCRSAVECTLLSRMKLLLAPILHVWQGQQERKSKNCDCGARLWWVMHRPAFSTRNNALPKWIRTDMLYQGELLCWLTFLFSETTAHDTEFNHHLERWNDVKLLENNADGCEFRRLYLCRVSWTHQWALPSCPVVPNCLEKLMMLSPPTSFSPLQPVWIHKSAYILVHMGLITRRVTGCGPKSSLWGQIKLSDRSDKIIRPSAWPFVGLPCCDWWCSELAKTTSPAMALAPASASDSMAILAI